MQILALFAPLLAFFTRAVVVKFFLVTGVVVAMTTFIPWIVEMLGPWIGVGATGSLSTLWSRVPPEMWWFIDAMRLDVGVPLILSAYVARFLIRRIPFFG